jgi:hypothetical protein
MSVDHRQLLLHISRFSEQAIAPIVVVSTPCSTLNLTWEGMKDDEAVIVTSRCRLDPPYDSNRELVRLLCTSRLGVQCSKESPSRFVTTAISLL